MKSTKSQIFLFDVIFSVVILIVSIGIVFSYFTETYSNDDLYTLNYDILDSMTTTKINSLNNEEIRDMFREGNIQNIENTLAQQIGEFINNGEIYLAKNLTEIFLKNHVNNRMNFNITMGGVTLFEQIRSLKNESRMVTKTQRDVFGFEDRSSSYEYTLKIEIWI